MGARRVRVLDPRPPAGAHDEPAELGLSSCPSLNHLIRSQEERLGDRDAERLGGLEVDHQFELDRLLDSHHRRFGFPSRTDRRPLDVALAPLVGISATASTSTSKSGRTSALTTTTALAGGSVAKYWARTSFRAR